MMKDQLIRIPLQFFGDGGDDFDDDFGYEDENGEDEGYDNESSVENSTEDGDEDGGKSGNDGRGESNKSGDSGDSTKALMDELRAMGYVGDDIASLTADIQKKRKSGEKSSAIAERKAAMSEGKNHVKSGRPAKGASGDSMDGFTERDLAEINACLKNKSGSDKTRARTALEHVTRTNSKK